MQPRSLDEARRLHPSLGFALYAYTPGGAVTLEVHDGGEVFSWTAMTEARAWEVAFPIDEPPAEIDAMAAARDAELHSSESSDPSQDADEIDLPEIDAEEPARPSVFD